MALHNEGDWRMETWQRARQGELSCLHTPIPELCNAILNTCQMPSRFYIIPSNVNKSQTHLLKSFIVRDLMMGHMQAKHAVCSGVLFWTVCTRRAHVLSLPSRCQKFYSWWQAVSWNCQKVMNGSTMWSCDTDLCTNGIEASKCWVFIVHFF